MALCKDRDHVVIADTNIEKQEQPLKCLSATQRNGFARPGDVGPQPLKIFTGQTVNWPVDSQNAAYPLTG